MRQMSLVRFELYKLLSRKSIWIFFGLMILGMFLPIQFNHATAPQVFYYQSTPPTVQQVQQAKTDLPKVNAKMQSVAPAGRQVQIQGSEFWKLLYAQQRDLAIIGAASGTAIQPQIDSLQKTIHSLGSRRQTGFAFRVSQLEYRMLKQLPFIGGGYYFGAGAEIINFIRTFGLVIFGAMIAVGLSPVFSEEYAMGADSLLMTTKRGKRHLVTAKLLASILYVVCMEVLLVGVNLISNLSLFSDHGFNYPLQSIGGYSMPFPLTIAEYIPVAVAIQLFGGITFGLVTLLLSSWNRSSLVSFFVSAGILAGPQLISILGGPGWPTVIMAFSYTSLIKAGGLFANFVAYNIFGYPLLYPFLLIGLAVLISVPIVWGVYFIYDKHQVE